MQTRWRSTLAACTAQAPYFILLGFVLLLWHIRGTFLVGWGLLGPAAGLLSIEQHGYWGALRSFYSNSFEYLYWNPTNSVLFGYLPGVLNTLIPSTYWGSILSLICAAFSLLLLQRYLKLPASVFCATVLVAPTLVCYSILSYPYGSCLLPHALILCY
ncbi:MAG: hypothetical protein KDD44_07480, partial [Bdellovibrionales bacterium]|nr:hypothetical protein [Bdellovibrionales bacterium]